MMRAGLLFVLHVVLVAVLIAASWIAAARLTPTLAESVYYLLAKHAWLTGSWLMLAVIGLDVAAVSLRDTLRFAHVGQKVRAHLDLSKNRGY